MAGLSKKLLAGVTATLAIAGGAFYFWDDSKVECFQYDKTVESYKICGTPAEIELVQFDKGVAMGNDSYEYFGTLDNCLFRALAQAEMFDWAKRYLEAYQAGCRAASGPTYKQQTKRDTNLPQKASDRQIQDAINKYIEGGN